MTASLLGTKLYIQPPRLKIVPRSNLVARINLSVHKKLTLISAPAGFGKTTLLQEWISGCGISVAWFSIDPEDNDLIRFWYYFVAALQSIEPEIGRNITALHQSSHQTLVEAVLIELINEIPLDIQIILVLDDYHLITETRVHDSLLFFLENSPPEFHLVLSSRSDPPWSLARLRALRDLTEIRAEDLRFTFQETDTLLNVKLGLNLSPGDVARLKARTEGWVAGLQMAVISLKGRENISDFIQEFSGSNRHIFDYLVEEILANQPPEITDFLLKTSILDSFCSPLCNSILDIRDSDAIIDYLDQANIFINSLDEQRYWYSYHALFRELLHLQLESKQPSILPALHARASRWMADNGRIFEAVSHAIKSGDYQQFASIAEKSAIEMVHQRELSTLKTWLDQVPFGIIHSRPWLSIAYAWVLVNACQLEHLDQLLESVEKYIEGLAESERRKLLGHIFSIRSMDFGQRGKYWQAVESGEQALKYLPMDDSARGWASIFVAHNLRKLGNLPASARAYAEAIQINQAVHNEQDRIHALVGLANIQLLRGQLHQAVDSYQSILGTTTGGIEVSAWNPVSGYIHSALGGIFLEWNNLDAALDHTSRGIVLSERWGQIDFLLYSYVQHVYTLMAIGKFDEANDMIGKIDGLMVELPEWPFKLMSAFKIRFLLAMNNIATAANIAAELNLHQEDTFEYEHAWIYNVLARLLIKQGKYKEAVSLLEKLLSMYETAGAMRYGIEVMVLLSIALHGNQQLEQAVSVLKKATHLAEPEGYVRTFIGEGAVMRQLLSHLASHSVVEPYVHQLVAAWEQESPQDLDQDRITLAESLTPREVEVLRFLSTNLTIPEIAAQMVVSANTVRTHVKKIYSKLGVSRRMSAVQVARQFKLI